MIRFLKGAGWFIAFAAVIAVAALFFGWGYINDLSVEVVGAAGLAPEGGPVLVVLPHPDDETSMGGTIASLNEAGIEVVYAVLTRGEAAQTRPPGASDDELGDLREAEVQDAALLLGVDEVVQLDLGDGQLADRDPTRLQNVVAALIRDLQPTTVLTYDDRVGLYGHDDHVATGQAVLDVVAAGETTVTRLWQATLSDSQIDVATRLSPTFAENYPDDPGEGLPKPDVAVRIVPVADDKAAAARAHETQAAVLGDALPGFGVVPDWLYFRILDREYFHLAFGS